jgi:hypothetical protein
MQYRACARRRRRIAPRVSTTVSLTVWHVLGDGKLRGTEEQCLEASHTLMPCMRAVSRCETTSLEWLPPVSQEA